MNRTLALLCAAGLLASGARADAWREPALQRRIDEGIERNRKSDVALEVVDAKGAPVSGAAIAVEQTRHAFLFGCNAFVLGQLATPELNARYESAFTNLFNFVTVPFYWEGTEPAQGKLRYTEPARDMWRRPPPERFIPWAAKHHLTLKGHPLLWHAYNPSWLPRDPEELRALYRKRFREIADRFATRIPIWDVVNESLVCATNYPLHSPDRAYVPWAFKEAAPLFPADRTLMINEVTSFNFAPASDRYLDQIRSLLATGAQVRGIGFQFHFFRRAALDGHLKSAQCDPGRLLDVYGKFSALNLPLFITEITIPSAGEGGEALQEQVVRDHYRLWFSAPRMTGITWWNLGDGTAVKGENEAKGGLMDGDLQPKPAYRALDTLINGEWKTRTHLVADASGRAAFRGFNGDYRFTVSAAGATRTFDIAAAALTSGPVRISFPSP